MGSSVLLIFIIAPLIVVSRVSLHLIFSVCLRLLVDNFFPHVDKFYPPVRHSFEPLNQGE